MTRLLAVAVVGHTNTGKTSLMRTLMRDVEFGEVSDRPAVTRHVEAAVLEVGGRDAIELFDTPGLEDSIGLLEHLDARRADRRIDGIDLLKEFLASSEARGAFAQEAKALRQVIDSDVALYVIDARERVRGKHRDELEILARCAVPVVPVLNFTASSQAHAKEWRDHLARVGMHAVAEFDTVVFEPRDEKRLYEKMATLVDGHRETLEAMVAERSAERTTLVRSSSSVLAELLVDVAACRLAVPANAGDGDPAGAKAATDRLRDAVREREQRAVERLLALHRFRSGDVVGDDLPLMGGAWGVDLFSPEALKQFGLRAGGAAATGAMVGLTADIMLGGLSLGAGAGAGAAIGGLLGTASTHGRKIMDRLRGFTELRVDEPTLRLLAARQLALVKALLRRGHAATDAVRLGGSGPAGATVEVPRKLLRLLAKARIHPDWSRIGTDVEQPPERFDPARQDVVQDVTNGLVELLGG